MNLSSHKSEKKIITDWNLSGTSKSLRTARLAAETLRNTNSQLKCCLFRAGIYRVLGYPY